MKKRTNVQRVSIQDIRCYLKSIDKKDLYGADYNNAVPYIYTVVNDVQNIININDREC